ncbi:hypothetical protein [Streptomyces sp. NBC_01320]|uniref:hypothetical protein n=1 Tax=Streptomyces sp. NBC_01320 TaxID=2903824 RepID=UPI002E10A843|nr:hypothetical protein OG395_03610 [Streptomyces sp. NBC_01320]
MTEVFDRAWDVLMVALGLSCVWVGCWAVLRPRQPLMLEGRPVWVVRAWGLGYVLLGISLTIESVTLMAGGEPDWPADVMRWVAGPLVVGSLLAAFLSRRWERRRARAMDGGGRREPDRHLE